MTHLASFEHNQDRMRYGEGRFHGSGVVEAGGKTVIGQRLKNSGMFWTEEGARSELAHAQRPGIIGACSCRAKWR